MSSGYVIAKSMGTAIEAGLECRSAHPSFSQLQHIAQPAGKEATSELRYNATLSLLTLRQRLESTGGAG